MRLDASMMRYLTNDDFRVLTAVEMGSKNHEVVPSTLIVFISRLSQSCVGKSLSELARCKLISKVQNAKYDGYRLAYGGYDYLALRTFACRGVLASVGHRIGVGKESDIYVAAAPDGRQLVLKIHRLGRISFRAVRNKRDYLRSSGSGATSWMYLSRCAATKEYQYLCALFNHEFPVPEPIDANRHCVLMERMIDAVPLCQITEVADPGKLFSDLMHWLTKLASYGLIHADYNEFNILVRELDQQPIIIDFPQMMSTSHLNAQETFERDVECVKAFFARKFGFYASVVPKWGEDTKRKVDLDLSVGVTGVERKLSRRQLRDLAEFLERQKNQNELFDSDYGQDSEDSINSAHETYIEPSDLLSLKIQSLDLDSKLCCSNSEEEISEKVEDVKNQILEPLNDKTDRFKNISDESFENATNGKNDCLTPNDIRERVAKSLAKSKKPAKGKENKNKCRHGSARQKKKFAESIKFSKEIEMRHV